MQIPHSQKRTSETPFGVFLAYQDWRTDSPAYYISLQDRRELKKAGGWYPVNHGQDIAEAVEHQQPEVPEALQKTKWMPRPSGLQAIGFVNVLQLV